MSYVHLFYTEISLILNFTVILNGKYMSIFRGLMCEMVCFVLENMMATGTFLCVFRGFLIL
jgi:hypothetical protein